VRTWVAEALAERVYRALFVQKDSRGDVLAHSLRIWPDPKPAIMAAIRKALRGAK
jgi:hypothetical protein